MIRGPLFMSHEIQLGTWEVKRRGGYVDGIGDKSGVFTTGEHGFDESLL